MFCCSFTREDPGFAEVLYTTEDDDNLQPCIQLPSDPPAKIGAMPILDKEDSPEVRRTKIRASLRVTKGSRAQGPGVDLQPHSESRSARGPKVREWKIQIEKTGKLGLDIGKDKTSMHISEVSDGPIKAWNDCEGRDPSEMVGRGDRILEVNGIRGDEQEILKTLSTATSLSISLSRLMEFRIANLPHDGPLGIEFDSSITQYLVIKAIGEGSAQTVNRKLKRECELRPRDMILEVNGEVGDAAQLEAALSKTSLLTLLVRRSA